MSWISSLFKEKAPSIQTQTFTDPAKANVANPLSAYLASEVGKGVPKYEDAPTIDPEATNRYKEFLGLNANEYFDKYVAEPQTEAFKRDFLPVLQEGYAGNLRGSGRYRSEEDAVNRFSEDLAGLRYTANTEIPMKQMEAATKYYAMQDLEYSRNYENWYKSLPENNPALVQAIQFLSEGVSSGTTLLQQNIPGQKGAGSTLLGMLLGTGIGSNPGQIGIPSILSAFGGLI